MFAMASMLAVTAVLVIASGFWLATWWLRQFYGTTLDDLVQLPPVQPHAPAFGAIINFHTLSIGHRQINTLAYWTFHELLL